MNRFALRTPTLALIAGLSLVAGLGVFGDAMGDDRPPPEVDPLAVMYLGNQVELRLALLGSEKAESPPIREFAKQAAKDHHKIDLKLTQLAGQADIDLTGPRDAAIARSRFDDLRRANGTDFDRLFLDTVIGDHRESLSQLELARIAGDDPRIAVAVESLVPTQREHLKEAEALRAQLAAGSPPR